MASVVRQVRGRADLDQRADRPRFRVAALDGYAGVHSNQIELHAPSQVSPTPAQTPRNAGRLTVALCM